MPLEDLVSIKDDMNAFILGHGLGRFYAFIGEEAPSVLWEANGNPDAWKDFVELAKASDVKFLTYTDDTLSKEDVDFVIERLQNSTFVDPEDDDLEDARWLRRHIGHVGFIQLGFAYQGTIFLYELSTEWYDRYQQLIESAEEFGSFLIDEQGSDFEDEK